MRTASLRRQSDEGFTLVELLAVIIIIGLLAAIAVPIYLDQKKKAHDAAAKADLSVVSKLIAANVVEHASLPVVTTSGSDVLLDGIVVSSLSDGVTMGALTSTSAEDWCIDDRHPYGDRANVVGYKFESTEGRVEEGQCP